MGYTWNANLPQDTDFIADAPGNVFRPNWDALETIIEQDHYPPVVPNTANDGFHKKSTYVKQLSAPSPNANAIIDFCLANPDSPSVNSHFALDNNVSAIVPNSSVSKHTITPVKSAVVVSGNTTPMAPLQLIGLESGVAQLGEIRGLYFNTDTVIMLACMVMSNGASILNVGNVVTAGNTPLPNALSEHFTLPSISVSLAQRSYFHLVGTNESIHYEFLNNIITLSVSNFTPTANPAFFLFSYQRYLSFP